MVLSVTCVARPRTDNAAADNGGGIFNQKGIVTLSGVDISGNISGKDGGGIHSRDNEATLTVTDSTFSGNRSDDWDGGGDPSFQVIFKVIVQ